MFKTPLPNVSWTIWLIDAVANSAGALNFVDGPCVVQIRLFEVTVFHHSLAVLWRIGQIVRVFAAGRIFLLHIKLLSAMKCAVGHVIATGSHVLNKYETSRRYYTVLSSV